MRTEHDIHCVCRYLVFCSDEESLLTEQIHPETGEIKLKIRRFAVEGKDKVYIATVPDARRYHERTKKAMFVHHVGSATGTTLATSRLTFLLVQVRKWQFLHDVRRQADV